MLKLGIKPIKELPDIIIYHPQKTPLYKMATTFMPRQVGWMTAYPINENGQKSLWIDQLVIMAKRRGFGSRFLDFAGKLSSQSGCGGALKLESGITIFDPTRPPHEFYRKYGFTSDNKKVLRKIDRAIKYKKPLNYKKTPPIIMYYPEQKKKSYNMFETLKQFISKIHKK